MSRLLLVLLLAFKITSVFCSKTDSLEHLLSKSVEEQKPEIIYQLIEIYSDIDSSKCFSYIAKLEALADEKNSTLLKGKSLQLQGQFYKKRGYFQKAIQCFQDAAQIFEMNKHHEQLAACYNDLGATLADKGDYDKAAEYLMKAIRFCDVKPNEILQSKAQLNIGLVFFYQKNYDLAQYYFEKCLETRKRLNDKNGQGLLLNNLGLVWYYKGNKNRSLEYFKKSLAIYRQLGNIRAQSMPLFNIAEIYFEDKHYDSAMYYYRQSFIIDSTLNDIASMAKSLTKMATLYGTLNNFRLGISYAQQGLSLANQADSKEDIKDAYLALTELYKDIGNYKLALEAFEKASAIKDTLYTTESAEKVLELQTKYETEKKDLLLEKQRETIRHQRMFNIVLIAGIIISLLLFALALIEYLQKKKAYQILEIQKKNITDSINYASRIQSAILPPEGLLDRLLPNNFILYMPKDIVSGDFYWVTEINDRIVIALADCTGHGVPGAFMSMLGFAFLNEIVGRNPTIHANQVLNELRDKVKQSLHQHENSETKDGMDIALIIINRHTFELEFSGANNPLIIVRNHELISIPADKMPIGFYVLEGTMFTLKTFNLQKGDTVYLFSDGYADQFGGTNFKKMGKARFEKILLEASSLPIKAQRYFLEEKFLEWQVDMEQIDDISIMGIQI